MERSSTCTASHAKELALAVAKSTMTKPTASGPAIADQFGYALADVLAQQLADMLYEVMPAAAVKSIADDLLLGAELVAAFTGLDQRQVYYLARTGRIPVFRMGTLICARKSTLMKWIANQEAKCSGGAAA